VAILPNSTSTALRATPRYGAIITSERTAYECRAEAERLRALAIENPKFAERFLAVAGGFERVANLYDVVRMAQIVFTPAASEYRN
jgi:hypothetical protein